jgi:hypothetical protein
MKSDNSDPEIYVELDEHESKHSYFQLTVGPCRWSELDEVTIAVLKALGYSPEESED